MVRSWRRVDSYPQVTGFWRSTGGTSEAGGVIRVEGVEEWPAASIDIDRLADAHQRCAFSTCAELAFRWILATGLLRVRACRVRRESRMLQARGARAKVRMEVQK